MKIYGFGMLWDSLCVLFILGSRKKEYMLVLTVEIKKEGRCGKRFIVISFAFFYFSQKEKEKFKNKLFYSHFIFASWNYKGFKELHYCVPEATNFFFLIFCLLHKYYIGGEIINPFADPKIWYVCYI